VKNKKDRPRKEGCLRGGKKKKFHFFWGKKGGVFRGEGDTAFCRFRGKKEGP